MRRVLERRRGNWWLRRGDEWWRGGIVWWNSTGRGEERSGESGRKGLVRKYYMVVKQQHTGEVEERRGSDGRSEIHSVVKQHGTGRDGGNKYRFYGEKHKERGEMEEA